MGGNAAEICITNKSLILEKLEDNVLILKCKQITVAQKHP